MSEQIDVSPIFSALTKHPTLFGVDYNYFLIEFIASMLVFINTKNILMMGLMIPLHIIGLILVYIDPHIFKLLSVKASIGTTKNKKVWRCDSYGEF